MTTLKLPKTGNAAFVDFDQHLAANSPMTPSEYALKRARNRAALMATPRASWPPVQNALRNTDRTALSKDSIAFWLAKMHEHDEPPAAAQTRRNLGSTITNLFVLLTVTLLAVALISSTRPYDSEELFHWVESGAAMNKTKTISNSPQVKTSGIKLYPLP